MSDIAPSSYDELAQSIEDLPTILRSARRMRHLSVRAAAVEIGVSSMTVSRVENGLDYDTGTLKAILRWLDDANRSTSERAA